MQHTRLILIVLCLSLNACSSATLLSSIGVGMGVAQKSTVSTIYSGVDLGVSATTDKSIREHILGDGTTDTEGSHLQRDVDQDGAITWVTPK
tara:strand:- start:11561 stop:11836 length:276 start_codon:yes stop_codon:yes gene_type:complete